MVNHIMVELSSFFNKSVQRLKAFLKELPFSQLLNLLFFIIFFKIVLIFFLKGKGNIYFSIHTFFLFRDFIMILIKCLYMKCSYFTFIL